MTRRTPPPPAVPTETAADRLQAAVDELAQNVCVLTDVVDQLREDLSWLTRNGVPHQPVHVLLHRMPHVTAGEGSDGSFDISLRSLPTHDPTAEFLSDHRLRDVVIDRVVERLAEPLGQLAQEQLNALLSVMDHAHREVLQAIRSPHVATPQKGSVSPKRRPRKTDQPLPAAPMAEPAEPPPSRGQLF